MKLRTTLITAVCFLGIYLSHSLPGLNGNESSQNSDHSSIDWIVADFLMKQPEHVAIKGDPRVVETSYGQSVYFDGVDDAIFSADMPLDSLEAFTIEMIFYPDTAGSFEQRVVHIGEVFEGRMLMEIRAEDDQWYFDGFVSSAGNNKALIDETLTHPLGQWHHVALVVTPEVLQTYVNGTLELEEPYTYKGIQTGSSSIGVRRNEISWFKGMIHRIRISPVPLAPSAFLKLRDSDY
ncbi:MAG: LamG domain-containing protein [Cyclobacteriaceae bacterium]